MPWIARSDAAVDLRRREEAPTLEDPELLILTPGHTTKPDDLARLISEQRGGPVLIILPKWRTGRHPSKAGWAAGGFASPPSPKMLPPAAGRIDKIGSEPNARGAQARGYLGGYPIALTLPNLRTQVLTGALLRRQTPQGLAQDIGMAMLQTGDARDADHYRQRRLRLMKGKSLDSVGAF